MPSRYRLTVRAGPKVQRSRFEGLGDALEALERRGRELEDSARSGAVNLKLVRRFEPVQQVTARLELSGPQRTCGGIDVRGDGSSEAYVGRLRRRVVEQREDESPYEALRRVFAER